MTSVPIAGNKPLPKLNHASSYVLRYFQSLSMIINFIHSAGMPGDQTVLIIFGPRRSMFPQQAPD
jgi:hypothetical protein